MNKHQSEVRTEDTTKGNEKKDEQQYIPNT